MSCQVDEDVDFAGLNEVGYLVVGHAKRIVPAASHTAQTLGHDIGPADLAEENCFHLCRVVLLQYRLKEGCDRMRAKVGRHVADTQSATRRDWWTCGKRF